MLNEACSRFREEFELDRPAGHAASCEGCRQWTREVESLRRFGIDIPLPPALRVRLTTVAVKHAENRAPDIAEPLPQVPIPPDLMAKLYRIPSESKLLRNRRPMAAKSGEMIAASFFFAVILTLGLGNSRSPMDHPDFAAASRIAGAVLEEAGNRGTQTILGVGESIFDGCIQASRSLEQLLGYIGEPQRDPTPDSRDLKTEPENPSPPPSAQRKETPHGNRQTH